MTVQFTTVSFKTLFGFADKTKVYVLNMPEVNGRSLVITLTVSLIVYSLRCLYLCCLYKNQLERASNLANKIQSLNVILVVFLQTNMKLVMNNSAVAVSLTIYLTVLFIFCIIICNLAGHTGPYNHVYK